jgi:hypothetical protein
MLDKLYLSGDSPESLRPIPNDLFSASSRLTDRYYADAKRFSLASGGFLVLKTQPNHSKIPLLRIELNPSDFKNLKAMLTIIEQVARPELLTIKRIDYKSDIDGSYCDLFKYLDVRHKISSQKFSGSKPTGCYFGRGTNQILVYDKSPKHKPDSLVRFEIREKKNSVTIIQLDQIPSLLSVNPFRSIRLMRMVAPPSTGSPKAYNALIDSIKQDGLFLARKQLGASNNFSKTYERYLQPIPESFKILDNFKNDLKQFIGEELNEARG